MAKEDLLVRGTTPTIQFVLSQFAVESITKAVLVIKQKETPIVEKDVYTIVDGKISFTLTQEETFQLKRGEPAYITCDWLTNTNVRGRSNRKRFAVEDSRKEEGTTNG